MQKKVGLLSCLLFSALAGSFTSRISKQPDPPLSAAGAVSAQEVSIWEHGDGGAFADTAPKKGFVPVPTPPPPPPADDGSLEYSVIIPEPGGPGANLSIATLMDMYCQEFEGDLWLLTRSTGPDRLLSDPYTASLLIDSELNIKATYDDKNVQIGIVRQIKEEKRFIVYYLYRHLDSAGQEPTVTSQKYFRLELTSPRLFSMLQQKRQGASGFEIAVTEVTYGEISGLK